MRTSSFPAPVITRHAHTIPCPPPSSFIHSSLPSPSPSTPVIQQSAEGAASSPFPFPLFPYSPFFFTKTRENWEREEDESIGLGLEKRGRRRFDDEEGTTCIIWMWDERTTSHPCSYDGILDRLGRGGWEEAERGGGAEEAVCWLSYPGKGAAMTAFS